MAALCPISEKGGCPRIGGNTSLARHRHVRGPLLLTINNNMARPQDAHARELRLGY